MSIRVPAVPPTNISRASNGTITNDARIATPVVGRGQWREMGQALNWFQGGGCMQLGWFGQRLIAAGGSTVFRTYAWPRRQTYSRLWTFDVLSAGAFGAANTASGLKYFSSPNGNASLQTIVFTELVSSTTPAGEEVSIEITLAADSPGMFVVFGGVSELPLPQVGRGLVAGGLGVDYGSLGKDHLIQDRHDGGAMDDDRYSAAGVARTLAEAVDGPDALRRAKIFSWFLASGVAAGSTSFVAIPIITPFLQTRKVTSAATRTVSFAVYASSTGDGVVRISSTATATSTSINVSSSTPAWYTATIGLACDDLSDQTWDGAASVTIEHRNVTGTLTTYGVDVGES